MKFKKLNGILSFAFFLSLFWTADRLDPGDNGSHSNDSKNTQPETDLDIDAEVTTTCPQWYCNAIDLKNEHFLYLP